MSAYDFLQANLHEIPEPDPTGEPDEFFDAQGSATPGDGEVEGSATLLVNAAKSATKLRPGDIKRVMSQSSKRSEKSGPNGTIQANVHAVYRVSAHQSYPSHSLVDRGANGGVAGNDVRVISRSDRRVDIQGIDNHQTTDIFTGTVGGVATSQKGPVIVIMHQYALHGKGYTIHSPAQLEWYKNDVNDKSVHVGGLQRITTPSGYVFPLAIKNGLPRMELRPFTDDEWDTLPHEHLTSEIVWEPSILDHDPTEDEQWFDAVADLEADPRTNLFDEFGDYRHRVTVQHASFLNRPTGDDIEDLIDQCVFHSQASQHETFLAGFPDFDFPFYEALEHEIDHRDDEVGDPPPLSPVKPVIVSTKEPDYKSLRPYFGWLNADVIKKTFENTTQYARIPMGTLLKRAFKSPNPALNVHRRSEPVACDIVYSDTPAIDNGSTAAVIFVGCRTLVTDIYGIKTDKQFVNTLEDNIRDRGAPTKLISDRAQVEIGKKVLDILRTLVIAAWQSEPHQQHQNYAENRWESVKNSANRVMDRVGAPAFVWLLCLQYVCFLLNHAYNETARGVPLTLLLGVTVDISVLLRFYFWQPVYFKVEDSGFPSESKEASGRIVGISEHVGNALTWKVLTDDTQKILYRSQVRPFSQDDKNLRADPLAGEKDDILKSEPVIKSSHDYAASHKCKQPSTDPLPEPDPYPSDDPSAEPEVPSIDPTDEPDPDPSTDPIDGPEVPSNDPTAESVPVFDPEDLVGRTFLMDEEEDGQRFRARIVKLVEDHETDLEENPTRIKFLCSLNEDQREELITYNKMLEYISRDDEDQVVWKFRRIVSHQGPLKPNDRSYNGSSYNIMIEWENGEITSEPLDVIAADDPVTCAIYAKDHDLLDLPGWKRFKSIAKRQKKFIRMVNQAKLRSYRTAPQYKYGFELPKNFPHAVRLDERNGNTRWQDAVRLEREQIDEYETFKDLGHKSVTKAPEGYKKIRVHLVFDVKHDGRHKGRLVADGHLTDIPVESVYSGVVSLRGIRLVIFLAELNGMETWATDIGNAYLEAKTSEKVYIEAGPEFGELEGHVLVIVKALYGLRSSGARWHDRFADCLRDLGFQPCKAEPDIWMRKNGDRYEYIAVYVDDLGLVVLDPQGFCDILKEKYNFKLKGTGPIKFHLGMDFYREDDGTLCIAPRKYIEKMLATYEQLFGQAPRQNVTSPIEKGDHPEMDDSELLDAGGVTKYQSLIGALQWVISIGRFDVMTAVVTLSGFRAAPREGHMERAKRMYGYLAKMKHACIRIRTDEPDYSDLPTIEHDWSKSVYGESKEMLPKDAPPPLGKFVTLTHYVDANLMHDLVTGRSLTGILHLINKTPIDWYSKKQATVETATYGSEFVAARTCVEQIIDLRTTLRYLGVPVRDKSYMFGDNKSVVDSSSKVHSKLHKRHTMLSFHRVREAVASGMVDFNFIPGDINPADILSKHWGYSQIWPQLKTVLFWKGDTAEIED
jgi:hypothetical protein